MLLNVHQLQQHAADSTPKASCKLLHGDCNIECNAKKEDENVTDLDDIHRVDE